MRRVLKENLKNLNINVYEYLKLPVKLRESYNETKRVNEINLYEYFKIPGKLRESYNERERINERRIIMR